MIAVEQLLVFDPVSTTTIYSRFNGHRCRHHVLVAFDITSAVFPCTPSEATVLLLTCVSVATYIYPPNIHVLHKIISFVP